MHVLTIPWRAVTARPVRSTLTGLGVAIAVAAFVSMTGLTAGVLQSLQTGLDEPGADFLVSQKGAFTLSGGTLPESLAPLLAAVSGVEDVSPVMFNITTADNDMNVVAVGWPSASPLWGSLRLTDGRTPHSAERNIAVLGESIAETLGKKVGDTIEMHYRAFTVVGIARFASMLNQNMVLVPLAELQALLSRPGIVSFYQVRLRRPLDPGAADRVRAELKRAAPDYAVHNSRELAQDLRLVSIIRAIASTVSVVILGLAMVGVANTLLMAVNERTEEFGILSAIGWPASSILTSIVIEGVVLAALGALVGLMLGIVIMRVASHSSLAAGFLQSFIDARIVVEALLGAVAIGALGALYPAWRAVSMRPAEALRRL